MRGSCTRQSLAVIAWVSHACSKHGSANCNLPYIRPAACTVQTGDIHTARRRQKPLGLPTKVFVITFRTCSLLCETAAALVNSVRPIMHAVAVYLAAPGWGSASNQACSLSVTVKCLVVGQLLQCSAKRCTGAYLGNLQRYPVLLPKLFQLSQYAVCDAWSAFSVQAVHHACHQVNLQPT